MNKLHMIIFLFGKDTFRSREQLKKMVEKFKVDRDPQGLNVVRVDAEKENGGAILEQVLAMPFLAERRMVVLENLLVSKNKETMEDLLKRIQEKTLPESNVIVFWEGTDSFKTKDAKALLAILEKQKYAQKFDELKGAQLRVWITAQVKEKGGEIENDAVEYLVNHIGGDMWRLSSLIEQILVYSEPRSADSAERVRNLSEDTDGGGSEDVSKTTDVGRKDPSSSRFVPHRDSLGINLETVQLFLDEKADDNIFNLVDAIVAKSPKQVYAMMQEQYKIGKDASYIFAMILRQFKILLQMRDLFEREDNLRSDEFAKKLGLHPFVAKKSLPLVKRYNMAELENIYNQLLEIDIQTKTGQGDQSMLLDLFVGRVCSTI